MERSQNWPDLGVTDMKLMRYTFYRHCYVYQSLKVSRQSFSRCSYDVHSNCMRWGHLTSDLVSWPCVTWVWNFHNICGKDVWWGVRKMTARNLKKNEGVGVFKSRRRLMICHVSRSSEVTDARSLVSLACSQVEDILKCFNPSKRCFIRFGQLLMASKIFSSSVALFFFDPA